MTTVKKAAKSVTVIIIFTIASLETDAYFIATTASVLVIGIIGMALGTTLIPILIGAMAGQVLHIKD